MPTRRQMQSGMTHEVGKHSLREVLIRGVEVHSRSLCRVQVLDRLLLDVHHGQRPVFWHMDGNDQLHEEQVHFLKNGLQQDGRVHCSRPDPFRSERQRKPGQ